MLMVTSRMKRKKTTATTTDKSTVMYIALRESCIYTYTLQIYMYNSIYFVFFVLRCCSFCCFVLLIAHITSDRSHIFITIFLVSFEFAHCRFSFFSIFACNCCCVAFCRNCYRLFGLLL